MEPACSISTPSQRRDQHGLRQAISLLANSGSFTNCSTPCKCPSMRLAASLVFTERIPLAHKVDIKRIGVRSHLARQCAVHAVRVARSRVMTSMLSEAVAAAGGSLRTGATAQASRKIAALKKMRRGCHGRPPSRNVNQPWLCQRPHSSTSLLLWQVPRNGPHDFCD